MADDHSSPNIHAHADAISGHHVYAGGASDEEQSVLEDDDGKEWELDYIDDDDDGLPSLSTLSKLIWCTASRP
ncbi:hypothetical protein ID866_12541 [Astraeus odoratus]|nr:hypothetical protein ID866_12541 [Astraeus odoratus]